MTLDEERKCDHGGPRLTKDDDCIWVVMGFCQALVARMKTNENQLVCNLYASLTTLADPLTRDGVDREKLLSYIVMLGTDSILKESDRDDALHHVPMILMVENIIWALDILQRMV